MKQQTKGNDAAFAKSEAEIHGESISGSNGLTKREYFAVLILQGMKASTSGCVQEDCSAFAVKQADTLIMELNK